MKAIVLASGSATRRYPMPQAVSKRLLPDYGKPMVDYLLSILMLAGIPEVLVNSTSEDSPRLRQLPGDGGQRMMTLSCAVQPSPDGIARAFPIDRAFCVLVLEKRVYRCG
jgi:glucose-1-phosphate thymidylyltransferase